MPTRWKERNKSYMNPSIDLFKPERTNLKKPEVPETLLIVVGESDLLL